MAKSTSKTNGSMSKEAGDQFMAALMQAAQGMGHDYETAPEVEIEHEGDKITLPADPRDMPIPEAITALQKKHIESESVITVSEVIETYPWDAAYAMHLAMVKMFGWPTAVDGPSGRPDIKSIEIGFDENGKPLHQEVTWGRFEVPSIEGFIDFQTVSHRGRRVFEFECTTRRKYRHRIQELAILAREYAKTNSLYRGKALILPTDSDGSLDWYNHPKFLNTHEVNSDELVFSDEVMEQVQTNLFTPIQHSDTCRKVGIPLKRGILLEGKYGVGKTLTASVTAKHCEANGWTFLMVKDVHALSAALEFAHFYEPAVLFVEDIDRAVTMNRDESTDAILNNLDGVDSKKRDIITVLTTNNVENIHKALLRPGRLDAVISVFPPDAAAAEKLMRLYGRGLIPADASLIEAGKEVAGQIPAVIREVVERAKLYAIPRIADGEEVSVLSEDLVAASQGMKMHFDLLAEKPAEEQTLEQRLGDNMADLVRKAMVQTATTVVDTKAAVDNAVEIASSTLDVSRSNGEHLNRARRVEAKYLDQWRRYVYEAGNHISVDSDYILDD